MKRSSALLHKMTWRIFGAAFVIVSLYLAVNIIRTRLPFNRSPNHGLIDNKYFKCEDCRSLIGGIFGKGPIKEFTGTKAYFHIHKWTDIPKDSFKVIATRWYGYDWKSENDFWNPPRKIIAFDKMYKAGDTTNDGRLIFFVWRFGIRTLVEDNAKHGIMIWNDKVNGTPQVQFEFSSQAKKRFLRTNSIRAFLEEIKTVPSGDSIFFYDICTSGSHYGIDDSIIKRVHGVCKQHSINLIYPDVICTCKKWPEGG